MTKAENSLSAAHPPCPASTKTSSLRGNFIKAIGKHFSPYRLGELLVSKGFISRDALQNALAHQRATGEKLGTILTQTGHISTVNIYKALAEQWCLRAGLVGAAVVMNTFVATSARAEDGVTEQFRMAAAIKPAAIRPSDRAIEYGNLFGTAEVRSNNIQPFTKWTSVMERFEDQMKKDKEHALVAAWQKELEGMRHLSAPEKIRAVNNYINAIKYIDDKKVWGKSDYWATPIEFMARGGDCEDYAIAKFASLRALGFSSEQLRVAIVKDKIKNIAHAVLIVYTEDGAFVLDNQNKRVENAAQVSRYQPIFSLNSSSWWLHRKAVS